MKSEVLRLIANAQPALDARISAADVAQLPQPVARHLAVAQVAGKRPPRTVHLHQSGAMRTAPDKGWVAMEAEEWFSLDPPGFIWRGSIRPKPWLRISAIDRFVAGHGSIQISAWGRIPISTVSGPEADSGELLRFLVEAVWFPAFWLSPWIEWQPIDGRSARASIWVNGAEVSSGMIFGEDGLLCSIEALRYRTVGKRFELTPWRGRCYDYREAKGVLIPHRIAVTWGLPQGDFEWFRASVDRIEYS